MSELKACLKAIRSISIDLLNLIDNTEIVGDYDIYDINYIINNIGDIEYYMNDVKYCKEMLKEEMEIREG